MYQKPTVTTGVERYTNLSGRPYSIAYVNIEGYDPPPGSRGYYMDWGGPLSIDGNSYVPRDQALPWRKRAAKDIRKLAKRLRAPAGTDFHQLIRLRQGLPVTMEPYQARSPELEDRRRVAEFCWELRQSHLSYPATLADLLKVHHHNWREIEETQ